HIPWTRCSKRRFRAKASDRSRAASCAPPAARLVCAHPIFDGAAGVERSELDQVQNYLRRLFHNSEIRLSPRAQRQDLAEFYSGANQHGMLSLDTEDGDRSYNLQIAVPETQLPAAQAFLRTLLGTANIRVLARPKKKDSA